jgi:hypothetical protein
MASTVERTKASFEIGMNPALVQREIVQREI